MISYKNRRDNTFRFIKTFLTYILTATNNVERALAVQLFKQQFLELNYEVTQAEQDLNMTLLNLASDFKWFLEFVGALHTNSLKWEITLNRVNDFKNMVNTILSGGNAKFMSLYNNPQTPDQWKEWMRYLYQDVIDYEIKSAAELAKEESKLDAGAAIVLKALRQWDKTGETYNIVNKAIKEYGNTEFKVYLAYKDSIADIVGYSVAAEMQIRCEKTKYLERFSFLNEEYVAYLGLFKELFLIQNGLALNILKITRYKDYLSNVKVCRKAGPNSKGWVLDDDLTNIFKKLIQLLGDLCKPGTDKNFLLYLILQIANGSIPLDLNTYNLVLKSVLNVIKCPETHDWSLIILNDTRCEHVFEMQRGIENAKDKLRKYKDKQDDKSQELARKLESVIKYQEQQDNALNDVKFLVYAIQLALSGYRLYAYNPHSTQALLGVFAKLFTAGKNNSQDSGFLKVHLGIENMDIDTGNLLINDFLLCQINLENSEQLLKCIKGEGTRIICIVTSKEIAELQKNPRYINSIKDEFKGKDLTFCKLYNSLGDDSAIRLCLGEQLTTDLRSIDILESVKRAKHVLSTPRKSPDVSNDMKI